MKLNKASLWLGALVVLAGCPGPEQKLSAVTVTCAPASVVAGQSSQCTASATDQDGEPFTVSGYTWTSSDTSVAQVDSTGKVTTVSAGTPTISASATENKVTQAGRATLTVTPPLGGVTVSCNPTSLEVGQTSQCTASATDVSGKPLTPTGYTWTSSNTSMAQVDSTGKVTALARGTPAIRASATWGGVTKEGQATLTLVQPTFHNGPSITTSETWLAANNPHVVQGALEVLGGATLTLEAGVEVRFGEGYELRVTAGALQAVGTPGAPIRMVARQSAPTKGYWRGVVLAAAGSTSKLEHVTLSHCGNAQGKGACLALENQAAPVLSHVSVRDSGSAGVLVADDGSAFGTGSTTLNVSGSEGYAVRIGSNQAGTLPPESSFTGNTRQAIELRGNVSRTQTWPNPGIPYVVNDYVEVRDVTNKPTLTIPAGTVLRFGPDGTLRPGGRDPGTLIVNGASDAPVLFTADSDNPQPGHWLGLIVGEQSGNTRISHAVIEYGGGKINERLANLRIGGAPARPVIENVTVRKSRLYGVYLDSGAAFGTGSTKLSAHDNGSYAIAVEPDDAASLPTDGTYSGNGRDAVLILVGHVNSTLTWPKLSIPYVINYFMSIGGSTRQTLTLQPGTEVRFGPEGGIEVGANGRPGKLWALGTYEEPIRFVPDTLTPTKGFWRGLHFWDVADTSLDNTHITHAGAGGLDSSVGTGNLNVYTSTVTFFYVRNSQFTDSSGCGVTRSDGTRPGTSAVTYNFSPNTFNNNVGGDVCTN